MVSFQTILPKQTPADLAEMARQEAEHDVVFLSGQHRRDSQHVGGGNAQPVNWMGSGQQMMGNPTGGMVQHDQFGQQVHHDQQIQYGQYGQNEHQMQYVSPQGQYDPQMMGHATDNMMQHQGMLQQPGMIQQPDMMHQPDMNGFDYAHWGGFSNQQFGSQAFVPEQGYFNGPGK
jgi:hypothetical protein